MSKAVLRVLTLLAVVVACAFVSAQAGKPNRTVEGKSPSPHFVEAKDGVIHLFYKEKETGEFDTLYNIERIRFYSSYLVAETAKGGRVFNVDLYSTIAYDNGQLRQKTDSARGDRTGP